MRTYSRLMTDKNTIRQALSLCIKTLTEDQILATLQFSATQMRQLLIWKELATSTELRQVLNLETFVAKVRIQMKTNRTNFHSKLKILRSTESWAKDRNLKIPKIIGLAAAQKDK